MKISKLGSALAFCLAVSVGQVQALQIKDKPITIYVDNGLPVDLIKVEFVPQGSPFKGDKQNGSTIRAGTKKSSTTNYYYDAAFSCAKFAFRGEQTEGDVIYVYNWDYCGSGDMGTFKLGVDLDDLNPKAPKAR
jgi:hypothetical protein